MFSVGDKIMYNENGVCTVISIGPLAISSSDPNRLYYTLSPLIGSGTTFVPVDSTAFMRPVMSREEAEKFIDSISSIEPAVCADTRFNHVDSFYRELFKQHTNEALVSAIKGLLIRISEKKSKSTRAEVTIKRAKDILFGELSISLEMDFDDVGAYIAERTGIDL